VARFAPGARTVTSRWISVVVQPSAVFSKVRVPRASTLSVLTPLVCRLLARAML
jgi:hypothetical protein